LPNKLKAGLQPHNSFESTFQKIKINYTITMGKEAKELKAANYNSCTSASRLNIFKF